MRFWSEMPSHRRYGRDQTTHDDSRRIGGGRQKSREIDMALFACQIAETAHDNASRAESLADLGESGALHFHGLALELVDETIAGCGAVDELVAGEDAAQADAARSCGTARHGEGRQAKIGDRLGNGLAQPGFES